MSDKVMFNQDTINSLHSALRERASQRLSGSASFFIVHNQTIARGFNTLEEFIVIMHYEGEEAPLAAIVVDRNTEEVVEWFLYI